MSRGAAGILLGVALLLESCTAAPATAVAPTTTGAPPIVAVSEAPIPSIAPAEPSPSIAPSELSPSPVPTRPPPTRCLSAERHVGPLELVAYCPGGAELVVEPSIDLADVAVLFAQVEADLAAVQREFAWTLRGRPRIDVFATTRGYSTGLRFGFGYSQITADWVADSSVAFFEPDLRLIAVNWEAVRDRRPVAAMRHELTHFVTLEACAPRCDLVPAWLNEGEARLAEAMIPGAEWRMIRVRYEAASMAMTGTLIPLPRLVTQGQWNAYVDWEGYYKYQEAARATELLREDVGGPEPIGRLYARIRRGENVATAYAGLAGRSFDAFLGSLPARIASAVPAGPGVALTSPGPEGRGVSYLLFGFAPGSHVDLRVRSRHVDESQDIEISPQGAYFATLDDRYPPGDYTIAVAGTSSLTLTKRGGHPKVMLFD